MDQPKKHIILGAPETLPFEHTFGPDDYDEPEDYAAMPEDDYPPSDEMGSCDGDGCIVMYELASADDHCIEEGTCWMHCSDPLMHSKDQNPYADAPFTPAMSAPMYLSKEEAVKVLDEALTKWKSNAGAVKEAMEPLLDEPPMPQQFDLDKTLAFVGEAIEAGPADVFAAAKGILEQINANGYVPTNAERVALFVAGLEAIAYSEHGQVVAIVEGRTLDKHRADFTDNECGVCENLDAYTSKALDLLKPIAAIQQTAAQEQAQEALRVLQGVCVDCGEKPDNGRTYSLEEGKGYMCSRCAGPYLIMDDGKVGDAFEEADA